MPFVLDSRLNCLTGALALLCAASPAWASTLERDAAQLDALPRLRIAAPPHPAADPAMPARFAVPVALQLSSARDGRWDILPTGQAVWRIVIEAPGARSLSARLRFAGHATAQIWVSGTNAGQAFGPYDHRSNGGADLWTPVVQGHELVLEWLQSGGAVPAAPAALQVEDVYFGFSDFAAPPKSGACQVDVACPAAAEWRDEVRSAARLVILGQFLCSAALVNNGARDGAGLLLTANHCVPDEVAGSGTVVYWNYQTTACNSAPDGSTDQTQVGARRLAGDAATDSALVRLLAPPSALFDVYYAGWDRRAEVPGGGVTLHHPAGQEKRISIALQPLRLTSRFTSDSPGDGNFLQVSSWDSGATEPGSSGAGLWNFGHRLVGQLSGGSSGCDLREPDWFGRLARAWPVLGPHLDPAASGVQTVDGMNADGSPGRFHTAPPPAPAPTGSDGGGGGACSPGLLLALALAGIHRKRKASPPRQR